MCAAGLFEYTEEAKDTSRRFEMNFTFHLLLLSATPVCSCVPTYGQQRKYRDPTPVAVQYKRLKNACAPTPGHASSLAVACANPTALGDQEALNI